MINSNDGYNLTRYDRRDLIEKIDYIDLNVCGVEYRLLKKTVRKFPGSVLANLSYVRPDEDDLPEGVQWNEAKRQFNVSRSPRLFDSVVLQYHANLHLHMPMDVCKDELADELAFWNLTAFQHVCKKCCGKSAVTDEDDDDDDEDDEAEKALYVKRRMTFYGTIDKWGSIRRNLRHFLQRPKSSCFAMAYAAFCVLVIFISIINFSLGTVDELQFCPNQTYSDSDSLNASTANVKSSIPGNDFFDVSGENFFSPCLGQKIFQIVDLSCLFVFTLDFILRLAACRNLWSFVTSPLHVIELIVMIPYYIEICLWTTTVGADDSRTATLRILRILQSVRLLVIFKLSRYFENLKIFAATVRYSKREFLMLVIFISIIVVTSSAMLHEFEIIYDENTPFFNMLISFWWGIVTISSVGYGDMVPASVGGKLVASFTCILGILCLAFPTTVLVENFRKAYEKNKKNKNLIKFQTVTKRKRKSIVESTNLKRRNSASSF